MSAQQKFLETYDTEHATTMRVLRAYPPDQLDLKPSPKSNTARQLAWTFVMECYLGRRVWNDEFAQGVTPGNPPQMPETWDGILDAAEQSYREFREMVASATPEQLQEQVHFFTAPKTLGTYSRIDWVWFLLHDQIHHRGQFSVYLRMAGGKLPSIYGPTADEPWR